VTETAGDGHLDLDTIAELDAGLVDEPGEARMRAHLDGCERCRADLARLRTTRALVSTLPPEPMPAQVSARIDAALAEAADTPATTTVEPLERRRRWRNTPTLAGAAAAAAVALLVGAIVTGRVSHHSDNGSAASAPVNAAGGASQSTALKEWRTDNNYTPATLGTLVPHLVTATPPAGSTTSLSGGATATGGTTAGGTGTGSAQSPASAVPSPAQPKAQDSTFGALDYTALAASPSAVLTCARILNGGPAVVPVAVDFARWSGKPAVVLVLPTIGHPESLDVWVVRSVCSTSSFDLYWRRIPRPAR